MSFDIKICNFMNNSLNEKKITLDEFCPIVFYSKQNEKYEMFRLPSGPSLWKAPPTPISPSVPTQFAFSLIRRMQKKNKCQPAFLVITFHNLPGYRKSLCHTTRSLRKSPVPHKPTRLFECSAAPWWHLFPSCNPGLWILNSSKQATTFLRNQASPIFNIYIQFSAC